MCRKRKSNDRLVDLVERLQGLEQETQERKRRDGCGQDKGTPGKSG